MKIGERLLNDMNWFKWVHYVILRILALNEIDWFASKCIYQNLKNEISLDKSLLHSIATNDAFDSLLSTGFREIEGKNLVLPFRINIDSYVDGSNINGNFYTYIEEISFATVKVGGDAYRGPALQGMQNVHLHGVPQYR